MCNGCKYNIRMWLCDLFQVGIDLEERDRKLSRNLMALARRRFSPEEADWLACFEDPVEQHQRFMQLWTLKVSFFPLWHFENRWYDLSFIWLSVAAETIYYCHRFWSEVFFLFTSWAVVLMPVWFMQEAYVKALGTGIRETPLKDFSFALTPSAKAQSCLERAVSCPVYPQVWCSFTLLPLSTVMRTWRISWHEWKHVHVI